MGQVDAAPTKEFFINMLTRDIPLGRSILDLIDNSVDAALANDGVSTRSIDVKFDQQSFEIFDNCGGISLETAKKYAFKFGRDKDAPNTPSSVGQFGVGMKRTLFKLGKQFEVLTNNNGNCYRVKVNIDEWISNETWKFDFDSIDMEDCPIESGTTKITVTELYEDISEQFLLEVFNSKLSHEVSLAHFKAINAGLRIRINDELVSKYEVKINASNEIGYIKKQLDIKGVTVTITAGLSSRDYNSGGWYIVCNGRLIAEADKSEMSGWGVDGIRKYHADFAFFRGLVEFEAEDSGKLPWTTTKTGVDKDNNVFRATLHHMKVVMREVISFLIERANETSDLKKELISSSPLNTALESAPVKRIVPLDLSESLIRPDAAVRYAEPPNVNVHYKVATEQLNIVKKSLGASSASAAGLETFNYYFNFECK